MKGGGDRENIRVKNGGKTQETAGSRIRGKTQDTAGSTMRENRGNSMVKNEWERRQQIQE